MMTYWYPGVAETLGLIKKVFPQTPVLLGGVYTSIYPEHAGKHMEADEVLPGPGEIPLLEAVARYTGWDPGPEPDTKDLDSLPLPATDLLGAQSFIPLLSSRGCPFRCAYCASGLLEPFFRQKSPESMAREVRYHYKNGVRDFAFYDDALLVDPDNRLIPFLEKILEWGLGVRFHTPNAVHVRYINEKTARIMHAAGFASLRMGLETTRFPERKMLDQKVTEDEFTRAVRSLRKAGFDGKALGAYLLIGLPDQDYQQAEISIQQAQKAGIKPILAHYSPIPGTRLWEDAKKASRYDLEKDPLYCNRAVFPCQKEPFSWNRLSRLKNLAR